MRSATYRAATSIRRYRWACSQAGASRRRARCPTLSRRGSARSPPAGADLGSAVLAAAFPDLGIGFAGVALAFGLTVLTMVYAVGHISGGHFNPAVSVGLFAGGRFAAKDLLPYIVAQVIGAIAAGGVLYLIARRQPGLPPGRVALH